MTLETFQRIFEELGERLITNLAAVISAPVNAFFEEWKEGRSKRCE